jgi:hypothetical protein
MTPVATYTVVNANAGRVYYDPDTHNLLEEIWQTSNSIQLLNAQMTPIATASIAYAQFSYNPKYNNRGLISRRRWVKSDFFGASIDKQ